MKTSLFKSQKAIIRALAVVSIVTLTGCKTRSISNAGFRAGYYPASRSPYRGELSQFDVLGEGRSQPISESDIRAALESRGTVKLIKGGSVLLVQSGAIFPDEEMTAEFSRHGLKTVPFTGVPEDTRSGGPNNAPSPPSATSFAKALRLTAARGGCESIVCYWGVLESASKGMATKTVSWTPIVGMVVPDETQLVRIRLMIALVDVRTGAWAVFTPRPIEDKATSTSLNHEAADQTQVQKLKQLSYEQAVAELVSTYGN
jgi:hypothetical protein